MCMRVCICVYVYVCVWITFFFHILYTFTYYWLICLSVILHKESVESYILTMETAAEAQVSKDT